jgi:hypothetical protein
MMDKEADKLKFLTSVSLNQISSNFYLFSDQQKEKKIPDKNKKKSIIK